MGEKRTKSRNLTFWTKSKIHNFGPYLDEKWPTECQMSKRYRIDIVSGKKCQIFYVHWTESMDA